MQRATWLMTLFVLALILAGRTAAAAEAPQESSEGRKQVTITQLDDRLRVLIGGELFAEYVFRGFSRPIVYPIIGPHGIGMTRNYPMKDVPGENQVTPLVPLVEPASQLDVARRVGLHLLPIRQKDGVEIGVCAPGNPVGGVRPGDGPTFHRDLEILSGRQTGGEHGEEGSEDRHSAE